MDEPARFRGRIARVGDYPNSREFFVENHTHLSGDEYEQANKPLLIWQTGDELGEEIRWLAVKLPAIDE